MSKILQREGWPMLSSHVLGGLAPKWGQEALGSLITCHQCSNAINEVDPLVMGPASQFHFKNRQNFCDAVLVNCLVFQLS